MDDDGALKWAEGFAVSVERTGAGALVSLTGELDIASRGALLEACRADGSTELVIDMSGLVFMDCSGWSGVVEAGRIGSSTVRGASGQPAYVMDLIRLWELAG
ncbi:MAG: hypothetical protein JWM34_1499 [Ilumatobacteraceae bacterium]|nr:hypothetical protein [Ilumatobacteraceae bacterium]